MFATATVSTSRCRFASLRPIGRPFLSYALSQVAAEFDVLAFPGASLDSSATETGVKSEFRVEFAVLIAFLLALAISAEVYC